MTGKNLARDFGIAWLVGPDQREQTEAPKIKSGDAEEEKKPTALGKH
jgi:hypothetical protein